MIIEWLLTAVAAVGAIIIVLLIAVFFIASAFMLLAAKIVRVENAKYGRAILATFLGTLVALAITIPLSFLGPPGTVLGANGKGLLTTLLSGVLAGVILVVVILIILGASFLSCVP